MFIRLYLILFIVFSALPAVAQERIVPQSNGQVQLSFAPLVKQVSPSVVNIYTKRTVSRSVGHPFMNDPFFGRLFRDQFFGGRMRRQVENSLGSGVIISADGQVVTNAHVIEDATEITVVLHDGVEYEADLQLADEASDLALLQLRDVDESLPFSRLKPSETLEVGDIVLAIGNPFGVGQTVTSGIVSALARSSLNINDFNFFIQTDAAINPGNSGGPLVSLDGGVVGINTAIYSRDGGSLGIGFAVPSEMVASVIAAAEMGQSGEAGVVRPWLGVTAQTLTSDLAESLGIERPGGAVIADLHKASPLRKAGMQVGDVVQSINGKAIRDAAEMKFRMATVPIGERADFDIRRDGSVIKKRVKAIVPPEDPPREATVLSGNHIFSGVTVGYMNPAVAVELGLKNDDEEGVVILEIDPRSRANRIASVGDVIALVNGEEIKDIKDLQKELSKGPDRKGWMLGIKSNGRLRQIILR